MTRTLLLALCLVLIAGCIKPKAINNSLTSNTSLEANRKPAKVSFSALYNNPDKYKELRVELSGQIVGIVHKNAKQILYLVKHDPRKEDGFIVFSCDSNSKLVPHDYIKIAGTVSGSYKYRALKAVNIIPISVKKITANDVYTPSLHTIAVHKTQSINNLTVYLEKIDISKNTTRVYIKLSNDSKKILMFNDFISTKLTQNQTDNAHTNEYKISGCQLDSVLYPHSRIEGILYYQPINYACNNCKFSINSITNNDKNMESSEFVFDISW